MASNQDTENVTKDPVEHLLDKMPHLHLQNDTKQEAKARPTVTIPQWLTDCESPFLWHTQEERGLGSELVILRCLEKLEELKTEEPEFSLQRFVSLLKLVLEYYITGDIAKSWATMATIEDLIEKEVSKKNEFYQKVKLSLGHVVTSTKATLLAIEGQEEKSQKISRYIIPIKIMASHDQAALQGMKARFFLYSGYENGENVGVELARKALELEPDNDEWEYLLAKMLRQQRRDNLFSVEIPREELKLLESAVARNKNPKILVYLAQVYRECAAQAFRQYRDKPDFFNSELHKTIEKMTFKALDYYKEVLELDPDSPAALRRIGYGIMNLPRKAADYDLALKCLLRSLELSENQTTMHILGTFYHRYGNDDAKAVEYFERTAKTGSHAGLSDLIRVKFLMNPEYDPLPDFEAGLKWELKKKNRTNLLVQLGGYFLFVKRDFPKSIEHFKQAIAEDKDSPHLKTFKSLFLRMNEPIDLYQYLANEALLILQASCSAADSSDDEEVNHHANLGYVEDFLDMLSEIHPELMEITPDPTLIEKLLLTSKQIVEDYQRKNNFSRSRGRGEYRPNQRIRGRGRGNFSETSSHDRGNTTQDAAERRGRFSIANQRDSKDNSGWRGRPYSANQRGRGQYENNQSNWRQQNREQNQRNENRQSNGQNQYNEFKKKNQREEENNWRKK